MYLAQDCREKIQLWWDRTKEVAPMGEVYSLLPVFLRGQGGEGYEVLMSVPEDRPLQESLRSLATQIGGVEKEISAGYGEACRIEAIALVSEGWALEAKSAEEAYQVTGSLGDLYEQGDKRVTDSILMVAWSLQGIVFEGTISMDRRESSDFLKDPVTRWFDDPEIKDFPHSSGGVPEAMDEVMKALQT